MLALDLVAETPALLYGLVVLFALVVGSFLNVVIYRLPRMLDARWRRECADFIAPPSGEEKPTPLPLSLARPGSHCPHCGHALRARENIPLLSYVFLRGRCAACAAPISPRYPLVEALTAVLSVVIVWRFGSGWESAAALLLTWGLIALGGIDWDTQLLPDVLVLPLLWLGLLASLAGWFSDSHSAILGAALGYGFLWSVFHAFRLLTGKEGMGYGDFKLFALFGAWLGWQHLPQILLLSSVVGALVGGALLALRRQDSQIPIPFGPYLAAAGWISLLWGDELNRLYLGISGLA